ncbi:MAG: adenosylmethionine decarboxylase [Caldilineaceae bacterium]|nr:adenosylmethionine decarboxylase [Caldilineaceae bacterium]
MPYLARHILVELNGCPPHVLNDISRIEYTLARIVDLLATEILKTTSYQFQPQGISTVMIIGASHLAVHSWPEHGYASVDVMVCVDNFKLKDLLHIFVKELEATSHTFIEVRRGLIEQ